MAEAATQPAAAPPAAARRDPRDPRRAAVPRAAGRAGTGRGGRAGHVGQHGRHRRRPEPARGRQGGDRSPPSATSRPAARSASSPRTGGHGSSSTRRPISGASARPSTGSRCRAAAATSATRSSSRASSRRARATRRSSSRPTAPSPRRSPARATVPAKVTVLPVGRERSNQAIVALAVRTAPSAVTRSVFVSVANLDLERAARRLEVWGDGGLIEVRDLQLDAQARSDVVIDDVPRDVATLELRLVGADPAATGDPDQLAVDDHAWAVIPPDRPREILVVGEGDPYLETALSLPAERRACSASSRPSTRPRRRAPDGTRLGPRHLRGRAARDPAADADPRHRTDRRRARSATVTGTLTNPGIGSLDPAEPILRYVDLSTTHIASAAKLTLPEWARTVIPGPGGAPLLYTGTRAGLPTAVLAFEPRKSDLPLQVAFPVLIANLTGELLGGSQAPTEAVQPGTPVDLAIPADATGLSVERPDGSVVELVPGADQAVTVTFSGTDLPGIYTVTPHLAPAGLGRAVGDTTSDRVGRVIRRHRSTRSRPTRFAVALFDVDESTIAPGSAAAIEALGVVAGTGRVRGPGRATGRRGPPDHARRAVVPDRAPRPPRPVRRMGRLPPRRAHPAPARLRCAVRTRRRRTAGPDGRLVRRAARAAPAHPGAAADGRAPPRGASPGGLGAAARRARRPVAAPRGARLRAGRVPARPAGRPARDRLRRRHVRFGRQRRARGRARVPARDAQGTARRRRRRDRRVRQAGARRAAAVRPVRDRPPRLDAGQVRDRHRRRAPPRDRALPGRRPEADRPALGRQRHDRRRPGRGRARRVAGRPDRDPPDRSRRRRRGAHRAADDAVDGAASANRSPVTVDIRSTVAQTATVRLFADGTLVATQPVELAAGSTTVTFDVKPTEAGFHTFRAVVEAARDTFSQNDRADSNTIVKGEPRTLVLAGDDKVAAELVAALENQRQQVDTIVPEALPTDFASLATYDSVVLVDVPRIRLERPPARRAPGLRPRPRQGPGHGRRAEELRRRRLPEDRRSRRRCRSTWACATARSSRTSRSSSSSTSRARWPPATATRSTAATRAGRQRHRRRPEGRHRQGGDPAGGRGADRARRARRRRLQRGRALGRPDAAARRDRRPPGPDRGHPGRRPDEHLRRARPGGDVARGRRPRPGATSSC